MLNIPPPLLARFDAKLHDRDIPEKSHAHYRKWLRYYLDFCLKYHHPSNQKESLPLFVQKLREKKQADWKLQQASHAVSMYYELLRPSEPHDKSAALEPPGEEKHKPRRTFTANRSPSLAVKRRPRQPASTSAIKSDKAGPGPSSPTPGVASPTGTYTEQAKTASPAAGASWKKEFTKLAEEIKLRHYSPRTLKTYRHGVRDFQAFVRSKPPVSLT